MQARRRLTILTTHAGTSLRGALDAVIRDDGGRRQPRDDRDGNGSRSQRHARTTDNASDSFGRTNGVANGSRPQEQHPPKQSASVAKTTAGSKSLRKEVVFAVGSCFRKRKDGGGRLGVARQERCGRGR